MSMISKYSNSYEKNYSTCIYSFVYRIHITQNDKEGKIRAELLLYDILQYWPSRQVRSSSQILAVTSALIAVVVI